MIPLIENSLAGPMPRKTRPAGGPLGLCNPIGMAGRIGILQFCLAAVAASAPGFTAPAATSTPAPLLALGTAWYPEQWPQDHWEKDLELMEAAQINVVRITEFARSTLEPREGQFEFDWLDRAIAAAARHHIRVVLGTPSAAPPAWLTGKYPETLRGEWPMMATSSFSSITASRRARSGCRQPCSTC
jgi:hypothetical protein